MYLLQVQALRGLLRSCTTIIAAGFATSVIATPVASGTSATIARWDADGADDDDGDVDGTPLEESPAKRPTTSAAPDASSLATSVDLDGEPISSVGATKSSAADGGNGGSGVSGGGAEGERALPKEALRELEVKMVEFTDSVRSLHLHTPSPPTVGVAGVAGPLARDASSSSGRPTRPTVPTLTVSHHRRLHR